MQQYLTVEEAANKLSVSRPTFWRLRKLHPDLVVFKFGSEIRIGEDDLEDWVRKMSATC